MPAMAFSTSRAGNATGLMRSLCSLMPISITLVSCSSSYAAAAAAGTSSGGGSSRGFALKTRGGASEEEASTSVCSPRDSGTNKHSFRSTGHPAVPDGLRLKQVVVICRHGDRAPVSSSLGKILDDGPDSVKLWNSKLPPKEERYDPPRGAEELRLVGEGLRGVLEGGGDEGVGGEGSLFPAGLEAEKSAIFVRCTRLKRTHQSAQNMLEGLGLKDGVDLYVRPPERETLWPSKRNRGKQDRLIARAIAESTFPGQAELKTKTAEMVGVPEDDVKWTAVREVLSCYEAHGVALPAGAISSGLVEGVVDYTGWMWGRWFEQREMARLSLGPFLAELLTLVGARGHETGVPEAGMPSTPKLAIFSGHDSTLVPILTALKVYDDVWPPYAR
ncbi:conserved unknown protein [Ectocarpus siliculosus]|uniref:Acid phosphatase n=1 Tax=Ectocarpus siliculosus TaxID=2880 RepID=D7FXB6_ECTSI|nr:conserved unknown protein [Ectocarpus siliculosus]|eukprot:CBJ32253.1 conserved unknown protein [Ectocarpus siliculosus]